MGFVSLQIPIIGNPNSTEAPKIASDFTALATTINGGLDTTNLSGTAAVADTQLASPNNSTSKMVLQVAGDLAGNVTYTSPSDWFITSSGVVQNGGSTGAIIPFWGGNFGGQWTVAGKSAFGIVSTTLVTNNTAPGVNVEGELLQITAVAGGASTIQYTGTLVAGSGTTVFTAPAANSTGTVVSAGFALPTANACYALCLRLAGGSGTTAAASYTMVSSALYVYNA